MESLGLSKALLTSTNVQTLSSHLALIHVRRTLTAAAVTRGELRRSVRLFGGGGVPVFGRVRPVVRCVSSSAASFASGGGVGGGVGGFGGGGGGRGDGEVKGGPVGVGVEDVSAFSSEVIILDVRGMTCGGCSASVKRILESQPLVSSASVNLTTETAIVWPVSEAKVKPNWQKVLGEELAKHLTKSVVQTLTSQGINVYLLSGDKKSSAEYVASVVGIPKDQVFYGVKPDEKNKFINKLQKDRHIVAMVGDGINDAAALASSHVGVAIGGGVGAASEVASIVLMGNKISQLIDALELSRQTMTTVKQNLWWAFGYNIVGIPIAAGTLLPLTGLMLTPSIAGALMGLSSIGVMTNSLLLRFRFASHQKKIHGASSSSYTVQEDIEAPKTLT